MAFQMDGRVSGCCGEEVQRQSFMLNGGTLKPCGLERLLPPPPQPFGSAQTEALPRPKGWLRDTLNTVGACPRASRRRVIKYLFS